MSLCLRCVPGDASADPMAVVRGGTETVHRQKHFALGVHLCLLQRAPTCVGLPFLILPGTASWFHFVSLLFFEFFLYCVLAIVAVCSVAVEEVSPESQFK